MLHFSLTVNIVKLTIVPAATPPDSPHDALPSAKAFKRRFFDFGVISGLCPLHHNLHGYGKIRPTWFSGGDLGR